MLGRRKKVREPKDKPKRGPVARFVHDWVLPLAVAAVVLTPLRSSVADWNDVPTGSMRPTILEGDRIFVNKLAFGLRVPLTRIWLAQWGGPQRGDIVTLASPKDGTRLVKRVIGLPGDRITLSGNRLAINGETVEYAVISTGTTVELMDGRTAEIVLAEEELPGRTHIVTFTQGVLSPRSFEPIVVPEGQYFMMGDNRDQSLDSRVFGFVDRGDIYGRSSYVALSFDPNGFLSPRFDRWFLKMQ